MMKNVDETARNLLPLDEEAKYEHSESDDVSESDELQLSYHRKPSHHGRAIIFHTVLFLSYSVLFAMAWLRLRHTTVLDNSRYYSPADEAIEYEPRTFSYGTSANYSVYVGPPRAELDQAWHKLLQNTNIYITESEIKHYPGQTEQGIKVPDGGYFSSLTVYHDLHCIKRLHHYLYEDHYYSEFDEEYRIRNQYHLHHCLDMLRQTIMCHGDTHIATMRWGKDQPMPIGNFTNPHKCVNWEKFEKWAENRYIDVFRPGYMVHPKFGPSYDNKLEMKSGEGRLKNPGAKGMWGTAPKINGSCLA